jgi:ATP-dependent NAD(P)H-hydrate dehydratase
MRLFLPLRQIHFKMAPPKDLVNEIKHLIPPLDGSLHKGQSGRVGVLGGARE